MRTPRVSHRLKRRRVSFRLRMDLRMLRFLLRTPNQTRKMMTAWARQKSLLNKSMKLKIMVLRAKLKVRKKQMMMSKSNPVLMESKKKINSRMVLRREKI